MKIRVNPHNVEIVREETEPINELEVKVSKCEFEFAEEITNEFVKEAYFTLNGSTYKQIIVNNECDYPSEVLVQSGTLEVGVVAYKVVNGQELIRYNPTSDYFSTWEGSLKEADNTEPITPTDKEQMQSQITQNTSDISNLQTNKQDKLTQGANITIDENNVISAVDTIYDDTEIKADIQELQETKVDKDVNNLTYYTLTTETGSKIDLAINSSTYVMTLKLKDKNNNDISTDSIDLPLETMVVGARYDSTTKEIVLTLKNGQEVRFSVADLVSGLQTEITENNKLSSDLVDDTNNTNKFVSAEEKAQITTNKNDIIAIKDGEEIDSFADVENAFDDVDTALGLKEDKSNKVTEINSSSTDTQYPSAKCVYDSQEEQNEHIAELEMLYNAFPTVSDEDTTIQLDNTAKVKFREIDLKGNTSQVVIPEEQGTSVSNTSIYVSDVNTDKEHTIEMSGNTYQETTSISGGDEYDSPSPEHPQNIEVVTGENDITICGKNLFNKNNADIINAFLNDSGFLQSNGNYRSIIFPTNTNTTYAISKIEGKIFRVAEYETLPAINSNWTNRIKNDNATNIIYTTSNKGNYIVITFKRETDTLTEQELLDSIMIEKGSTASTYEAYTGTTYPVNLGNIELCRLNVNDTIYKDRIYKQNDKWYLKKNISKVILNGSEGYWFRASINTNTLRFNNETAIPNGYVISAIKIISNKFINGSGPSDNGDYEHIRNGGSDYTNSLSIIIDKTRLPGNTADDFTTWLSTNNVTVYYLANATTTEITDSTLVSQLNALANSTLYATTNINTITSNLLPYIDLQYNVVTPSPSPSRPSVVNVVKGENTITIANSDNTESQSYPINLGDIELCKIGTYQDYIYESNGNWFKKGNISKIVFNGNENWEKGNTYTNTTDFRINSSIGAIATGTNNIDAFCDNFVGNINGASNDNEGFWFNLNGYIRLKIRNTLASTKEQFQNWLSTHNTTLYFILATPTDTQITDTTLITQLDNIKKAYSYDTQTNISQTNTDKPFIIYAEAIRSLKDVFE